MYTNGKLLYLTFNDKINMVSLIDYKTTEIMIDTSKVNFESYFQSVIFYGNFSYHIGSTSVLKVNLSNLTYEHISITKDIKPTDNIVDSVKYKTLLTVFD